MICVACDGIAKEEARKAKAAEEKIDEKKSEKPAKKSDNKKRR